MSHQKPRIVARATRLAVLVCLFALFVSTTAQSQPQSLLLATTTSVQDSGLLDVLLPPFTEGSGIIVRTVAVGTGAALRMGAEGNADVLLTHAPAAEKELLSRGALSKRIEIMDNYFIIAGPPEDPAGISDATHTSDALKRIQQAEAPFVSRADDSGTHKKESRLLRKSGIDPTQERPGLTRTGSGMGASLLVAGQRRAYILSDIGTFLAFRDRIDLAPLTPKFADLRNVYSILLVSPERFPKVRTNEAQQLASYLQSTEAQAIMMEFGRERFGQPLFSPLLAETAPR